ncbi:MAG: cytochrome B6 [Magnetospirillum sp.]|nr:cytochrome B6 [Magnetospirillum sp.]
MATAVAVLSPRAAFTADAVAGGHEPIRPLMAIAGVDPAKAELGRRLFHDPMLSRDGTVSCASCHVLDRGGSDGRPVSMGIDGRVGIVNAPTVYNAAFNLAQFWDGRAMTLEDQVNGPLTNAAEMGTDWPTVLERLARSPYAAAFRTVFGAEPDAPAVRAAIAAFERTLITTGSRFDRWLGGEAEALSASEKAGYALFKSYGCASCHQGAAVGGNMFQRLGFFASGGIRAGGPLPADLGRFNVTGRPADRNVFKVPSLRLVTLTPPYFHTGEVATLDEAIRLMGRLQLGRDIPDRDVALIAAFLGTLVDPAALATP